MLPVEVQGGEWKGAVWLGKLQTLSIQLLLLSTFATRGSVDSDIGFANSEAQILAAE
jgi:hypothetical protein